MATTFDAGVQPWDNCSILSDLVFSSTATAHWLEPEVQRTRTEISEALMEFLSLNFFFLFFFYMPFIREIGNRSVPNIILTYPKFAWYTHDPSKISLPDPFAHKIYRYLKFTEVGTIVSMNCHNLTYKALDFRSSEIIKRQVTAASILCVKVSQPNLAWQICHTHRLIDWNCKL